jgi:hypothetical protein
MNIRRFNQQGVDAFREYLRQAKLDAKAKLPVQPVPAELLTGDATSEPTSYVMPALPEVFVTKMDLASFVDRVFPRNKYDEIRIDVAMWTWLAACMFDQITNGRKKLKEERAYVAGLSFQEFYRHLVLGPYFIFFNAKEDLSRVQVLLYDDPTTMNEVMVQFGSYQSLMQNKGLQAVVQRLYFDPEKGRIKRGAGGKEAGTPRRLMDFFRQIELNYDLQSVSESKFWDMIPAEFSKFKNT